ncbi:MAG: C39 family peptidase [Nocardioidaceae bacterium]
MQTTSASRVTRRRTAAVLATALAAVLTGALVSAPTASAGSGSGEPDITLKRWTSRHDLQQGHNDDTRVNRRGMIRIDSPGGTKKHRGHRYDFGRWTSPWTSTGFGADEIIASWNAITPKNTWIKVQLRGKQANGKRGSWDTVAYWTSDDNRIERRSMRPQHDDYSSVRTDTVTLDGSHRYTQWKVRVVLLRPSGTRRTPKVDSVGAVASALPSGAPATSRTTVDRRVELDVPGYSQMLHEGDYPRWDGGGEAWCSPTSTSMVLRYFDSGPTRKDYRWVKKHHTNRFVDAAARSTYDYRYEGTGNWPFNTAYAGSFGLDAFVTRLASLRDAERLVRAGIPVVASVGFGRGELDGAPISATNGHLLVIVGFTAHGNPIVNDPAAHRNGDVRHVYKRRQFERAWLGGSGGVAYVIHPDRVGLPSRAGTHRW